MLNEGTTALPYEPYGTGWYLNKQIGKVVLDGSEDGWDRHQQTHSVFYIINSGANNLRTPFAPCCNYYLGVESVSSTSGASNKGNNTISFYSGNNVTYRIYVVDDRFGANAAGLVNFKTWLTTHNTTVYYVLETPTYTEITDTTLLSQLNALEKANSYDNQTNVSQTNNDLASILNATALKEM